MDYWKGNKNGYENETEYDICMAQPCATCKSVSLLYEKWTKKC